ncbi:ABC transporter permease [Streptomyces tsukubensis]|uniref:Oligopeptide transport system permease protein OppC n=1 Tax=Streptomyces tsukubensis TaxID=83656 RepID=A0A1V4ABS2_9ACTN|nr:ABC transporter permease [Streptomyces tsukubensis]OON81326.1 peptide ABC transporter permease [Streptomyces tsukubensis]QFR95556.1 ABC transporter permease subunit [Streptomyces tsukubensis]
MAINMPGVGPDVDGIRPEEADAKELEGAGKPGKRLSPARLYMRRFLRNKPAVVGLVLFVLLALLALTGRFFTHWNYEEADFTALTVSPGSSGHLLGTNPAGNDVYAQLVHGLGRSLIIALTVSLLTTAIAALFGATAAYLGGRTERLMLGFVHFLLILPSFLIIALVGTHFRGEWPVLVVVLTIFGWMLTARVIWSLATSLREREYVMAARFMGVSPLRTIVRHMVRNIGSLLIVTFTLGVASTVQSETALSFIGFGVKQPDISLGAMLADGQNTLSTAPWLFYLPAAVVLLLTVAMALIGDGLRDALDPTSHSGGRA